LTGDACVVDAHLTAFFARAQNKESTERFYAEACR
jgi:hypothetical protein